jgi:hypothetical protein
MTASEHICSVRKKSFLGRGKQKFLRFSGPCSARFHFSCLQVSDTEYTFGMANCKSTYKCGACAKQLPSVRDKNNAVRSLRSASTSEIGKKIVSRDRELILPLLKGNDSLCPAGDCWFKWCLHRKHDRKPHLNGSQII